MEEIDINLYKEEQPNWAMEKDTLTRVHHLGADAKAWREFAKQGPAGGFETEVFNKYIHLTGRQVMQTQMQEDEKEEAEIIVDDKKRQKKAAKILRRKVNAREMEDGLVEVLMDREWDTTGWSKDEIWAACEYLTLIFELRDSEVPKTRKERALMMLEKLLFRHKEAKEYMRYNLDLIIGKAANRKLRGGASASKLDVMMVIKSVAPYFNKELSTYNFIGRFAEMALLEMRLAAVIIQHAYRSMRERRRPRHNVNPAANGFGSDEEMALLRTRAITVRSEELRSKWQSMHFLSDFHFKGTFPGVRGPAHVAGHYLHVALDIFLDLVSSTTAGAYAPSNRGDLVKSKGTILLANFLSFGHKSQFAEKSVHLICCVSRLADSFYDLVGAEAVTACRLFGLQIRAQKQPKLDSELFLNILRTVENIALHAAGTFRGREGYNFIVPGEGDLEAVDYQHLQAHFCPPRTTPSVLRLSIASQKTLDWLGSLVKEVTLLEPLRVALGTLYALACGDAYVDVLAKVSEDGATLLIRLVDLLEEDDLEVATIATCLLLQLCTLQKGRTRLMDMKIETLLKPLMQVPRPGGEPNYRHMPYTRACAVALALCRQEEWRAYEPKDLRLVVSKHDNLKESMYMDVLYTIRGVTPGDTPSYKTLAHMPMQRTFAFAFSQAAYRSDVRQLSNFFCHPHDEKHFFNMDWDKAACVVAIIEGFSANFSSAVSMFSSGTVRFVGQCLTLAKFEFVNPSKRMSEDRIKTVLMGVLAATNGLSNFCDTAGKGGGREEANVPVVIHGTHDAHLIEAASFFINTLGQKHPELAKDAKRIHEESGFAALRLANRYACMALTMDENSRDVEDVLILGKAVSYVIRELRVLYGSGSKMVAYLDRLCEAVGRMATPGFGANAAINDWGILKSLREHLPPPLSGLSERALSRALSQARQMVESVGRSGAQLSVSSGRDRRSYSSPGGLGETRKFLGTTDEDEGYMKYRKGLGTLSDTFFTCLYRLAQLDQAKDALMTDGFIRRCLDKLHLLAPALEGERELGNWAALLRRGKVPPDSLERREMESCLRLLSRVASYASSKAGNVNDLIMHKFYDTIGIACKVGKSRTCPRGDPCFLAAWRLLASLSLDPSKTGKAFKDELVVEMCRELLREVDVEGEQVPDACLDAVLDTIAGIIAGPFDELLAKVLPMMRISLSRVSRLRPTFTQKIVDINYLITKAQGQGQMARDVRTFVTTQRPPDLALGETALEMVGSDSIVHGLRDEETERTWNQILVEQGEDEMAFAHSMAMHNAHKGAPHLSRSPPNTFGASSTRRSNFIRTREGEELELMDTPGAGWAGYYSSCGIGSCGSLRFPGQPCTHCGFVAVSPEQAHREIGKLPVAAAGDGRADVSKLTAREPELRRRIMDLKIKHGYMDKKMALAPAAVSVRELGSDGALPVHAANADRNHVAANTSLYTAGSDTMSPSAGLGESQTLFGEVSAISMASGLTFGSDYGAFPGASPPPSSMGGSRKLDADSFVSGEGEEELNTRASARTVGMPSSRLDVEDPHMSSTSSPNTLPKKRIPTVTSGTTSLFSPLQRKKKDEAAAGKSKMMPSKMVSPVKSRIVNVEDLPELRSTRPPLRPVRK